MFLALIRPTCIDKTAKNDTFSRVIWALGLSILWALKKKSQNVRAIGRGPGAPLFLTLVDYCLSYASSSTTGLEIVKTRSIPPLPPV